MPRIASRQHPLVQRFRRLQRRREPGVVLVDGAHLLEDAVAAGLRVQAIITDRDHAPLARRAQATSGPTAVYEGTASVLEAASPVASPTGIVGIVEWTPRDPATVLASAGIVLGLVDVQDPGNVGSAIRSADALGAAGVLLLGESAHPDSWRALRGAMGSTFRIPVARGASQEAVAIARQRGITMAATVSRGGTLVTEADLRPPVLLLVGNEGAGLPDTLMAAADRRVSIPMRPGIESLNVAVAAALLLWTACRSAGDGR